ncbi:MAG: hypothetical protein KDD60_12455, partial [Bdellovibrionales bacterium]|nr:hypothetical protein [Bdellovibrionales bacterium]
MRHIRVLVVDELVELIKRRRAFIVLLLYILLIGSLLHGFSKVQSSVMTFLQERGGGIQIQGEDVLKAIGHFEGKAAFEHVLKWP